MRPFGVRWRNIPIPEPHLAGIIIGLAADVILKRRLFRPAWIGHAAGWPLVTGGIIVAAWAVVSAGTNELAGAGSLVDHGPYRYSRHPMYVAWSALYVGIALVLRSPGIMVLTPLVFVALHFLVVYREEREMERQHGDRYRAYRRRVRRYL